MKRRNFIAGAAALAAAPALPAATNENGRPRAWMPNAQYYYVEKNGPRWILGLHNPALYLNRERYTFLEECATKIAARAGQRPCLHLSVDVAHDMLIWDVNVDPLVEQEIIDKLYCQEFPGNECTMTMYTGPDGPTNLFAFTVGIPVGETIEPPPPVVMPAPIYEIGDGRLLGVRR